MEVKLRQTNVFTCKSLFRSSNARRIILTALLALGVIVIAGIERQFTTLAENDKTAPPGNRVNKKAAVVCDLGSNLIVNSDAEADPAATGNGTTNHDVSSWENETGTFTVTRYNSASGFPTSTSPGPGNRGTFFFSGGTVASSGASQVIDVSGCAAEIDGGSQQFNFSGFLGGFQNQNDQAQATVTFKNAENAGIGTALLGPVTAADRGNVTGLFLRNSAGIVPVGTRTIELSLQITRFGGTSNDGYADNLSLILTSPQACAPLPFGIVSWWKAENDANDFLGLHNGILQGKAGFAAGKVGQAFDLTSPDDSVDLGNWFTLPEHSITMWVKAGSTQLAYADIIDNNHDTGINWVLQQNASNTNSYVFGDTVAVNFNLTADTWHFFSATRTNNTLRVYIDGVLQGEQTGLSPINYNGQQFFRIGRFGNPSFNRNWNGLVDELDVYNRALSEAEIQSIYNAGSAGKCNVSCAFTLNPTSATVTADAVSGSFTVNASAGCGWTAISNDDWITTSSSGNGNGTVNFTVAANPGAQRTGTITVGGQTFTVSQEANSSQTCAPLPSGIVSWLKAEGNANDVLGINNGVLQNGTAFSSGLVGQSFNFDGVDDHITMSRAIQDDFTIEFWLNTAQIINSGSVQWYNGRGLVDAEVQTVTDDFGTSLLNGKVYFGTGRPDVTLISGVVADGSWHHVTATRKRSTGELKLYIDGTQAATGVGGTQSLTAPPRIVLGRIQVNNNPFQGKLDEVSLYNRVLAPSEIQAIYNAGVIGKCGLNVIQSLTLNPNPVNGGQSSTGTIVLASPAPVNGAVVNLNSDNPDIVEIPSSITIASGQTNGTFQITTFVPATDATALITASYQSETASATLTVTALRADLTVFSADAPSAATTDAAFNISWTLKNQGPAQANAPWKDRILISADSQIGNDTLLGEFPFSSNLEPNQTVERIQSIIIPRSSVPANGQYFLIVQTDAGNQVDEDNENNNFVARPIEVTRPPKPDLIVESIVAADTAFFDQTILVQWTIKNIGGGQTNASDWQDFVYLSADNVPEIEDPFKIPLTNVSYLAAGESYTATAEIRIPRGLVGQYKIIVWTDGDGSNHRTNFYPHRVAEESEENNHGIARPIQINAPPLPDLQTFNVVAPEEVFAGGQMSLSWRVENRGSGITPPDQISWQDKIYLSQDTAFNAETDRLIGSRNRSGALPQNEGYTVSNYNITLPNDIAGDWYVFILADGSSQVYEFGNENNNADYDRQQPGSPMSVIVTPPDLIIPNAVAAPNTGQTGQSIVVSWTVQNQGAFDAAPSWFDGVYLSQDQTLNTETDTLLASVFRNSSLGPGLTYNAAANVTLPSCISGTYYLFVLSDSRRQIFEFDPKQNAENNNTSQPREIAVSNAAPDLFVTSVSSPTTGNAGQPVNVSWTIANQGAGSTVRTQWTDRIYLSPTQVLNSSTAILIGSFQRNGALNNGESYVQTENLTIPHTAQGNYFVIVLTDANGEIEECANNENNTGTRAEPLTVNNSLPDLIVQNAAVQSNFTGGQTVNVNWTIANNGTIPANNPTWGDAVYFSTDETLGNDDQRLVTTPTTGPLTVGDTYNRQAQAVLPVAAPGNYFLIVQTDYLNNVFEGQGENNNQRTVLLPIEVPAVDLTVTAVNAPESTFSGQNMTVDWTIINNGVNPTVGAQWTDELVLSLDQIDDPSDRVVGSRQHNGVISGGGGYNESLQVFVPQGFTGQYYVFVRTDRRNNVAESNENNNSAKDGVVFNLTPPADLIVTSINSPASGSPGEPITLSWTVQNIGANPALGIWNDAIYLSPDQTWDINDVLIGKQSQVGPVAGGQSYNAALTLPLPAVNPGNYYVIVRSDVRNFVRESVENNNINVAGTQTSIDLVELQIGVPRSTTLVAGQEKFYKTNAPANETLQFILNGQTGSANELFARFGQVAGRNSFDFSFSRPNEPNQEIVVPNSQSGNYFTMARSQVSVPQPQNVTIKAEVIPFGITSVSPNRVGDNGQVTITLKGARFEEGATVKLVRGGTILDAANNIRIDSSTVKARFLFTNAPRGVYDVVLTNPGGQATARVGAVTIEQMQTAQPTIISTGNLRTRPQRPLSFYNEVSNRGNIDIQYVSVRTQVFRPNSTGQVTIINYRPANSLPRKSDFPTVDWNNAPLTNSTFKNLTSDSFVYRDLAPGETISYNTEIRGLNVDESYVRNQIVGFTQDEFVGVLMESAEEAFNDSILNGITFPDVNNPADMWKFFKDGYESLGYFESIRNADPSAFRTAVKGTLIDAGIALANNALVNSCNLLVDRNIENCNYRCAARFGCSSIGTAGSLFAGIVFGHLQQPVHALIHFGEAGFNAGKSVKEAGTCFSNCPQPPPPDCELTGSSNSEEFTKPCVNNAIDPNEKLSPDGYGEQRFVSVQQEIPYTVNFENLSTATAYAQKIRIIDRLDPNLDWRTFRLKEIGFKQYRFQVPENRAFFQQRVQLGADLDNLLADISAGIDITTGTVTWTLTAVDPATGEQPNGVNLGLLPPNNDNSDGQGFVTFTVKPKVAAPTGSVIRNEATIIFDTEEPINTNVVSNTLDAVLPESQVAALPTISEPVFTLNWSGDDSVNGSGLRSYDILVSENGEAYQPLVNGTTNTSVQFTGIRGRTYRFYSIARDNSGNVEEAPVAADAATTISGGAFEADVAPRPNGSNNGAVTVADLTQVGRFVAGVDIPDQPTATNEFQRTDCAPRTSSGNGSITVADITQAGRYAAGLDAVQAVGGAISPSGASPSMNNQAKKTNSSGIVTNLREIYPVRVSRTSNKIVIAVELNTGNGKEKANSVGFTLNYNPAILSNPANITLGNGAAGATLISNSNQAAQGRLGIVIFKPTNQTFPDGVQQLVRIEFDVAANAPATTEMSFGDQPVVRDVSDVNANSLPANFATTNVSLTVPTAALVTIGGRVTNAAGMGIGSVNITMSDISGIPRRTLTNPFGYYHFTDVPTGTTVVISAASKRYSFNPNTQVVSVKEDNFGINFVADE